jgi:hypothetical protein
LSFALEDEKSGEVGWRLEFIGLDLGGGGGSIFTGSNLTGCSSLVAMVEQTLLSPVVGDGKTISLAEMYIQNKEWRDSGRQS